MESKILQIDQFQYELPTTSDVSFESLTNFSLTSGGFDILGLEHGEKGFLGRHTHGPPMESRILQIDHFQHKLPTTSDVSFESLTNFSLTSGEYLDIHIKTLNCLMKEKEVTSLQ